MKKLLATNIHFAQKDKIYNTFKLDLSKFSDGCIYLSLPENIDLDKTENDADIISYVYESLSKLLKHSVTYAQIFIVDTDNMKEQFYIAKQQMDEELEKEEQQETFDDEDEDEDEDELKF